ncbi:PDZ domain-containing protein [Candidatus Saccharibacteria bacterium]|jgi:carboxyl-terminal processing protease|nr:PDZ domain-containing protein [Candidatus Saccharibacteria bacterium]
MQKRDRLKPKQLRLGAAFLAVSLLFFALGYQSNGGSKSFSWLRFGNGSTVKAGADVSVNVEDIYDTLREKFDGDLRPDEIENGIRKGLVSATGDPYTTYFTKDEYADFQKSLNGEFSGIGAQLGLDGDQLVVIAPLDGFPAQKAGLSSGEAILEINGESTEGMSVDTAVGKIRGEAGTKVKLKLAKIGQGIREIDITRENVKVDSVKSEVLEGNIGYIKISQFSTDTYSLASKAVSDFKVKGITRVILDLRNNGGGYVDSAVNVAGLWLDSKTVLSERARGKEIENRRTTGSPTLNLSDESNKLVVLVNSGSASASEILAAALQEEGGVKLVGEQTFGKGSVQDVTQLKDGGSLKVTIAHWFTPKGKSIDKEGIKPDIDVKLNSGDSSNDSQKQRALEVLKAS